MGIQDRMWKRLIGEDPRRATDGMLDSLREETGATGAALFLTQDPPELVADRGAGAAGLDRTRQEWEQNGDRLRDGRPCLHTRWCLWPIESPRGPHLVYLAADHDLNRGRGAPPGLLRAISDFASVFAVAATSTAAIQAAIDTFLMKTSDDAIARRKLEVLLEHHAGNKSAVARSQDVSRLAIYRRIKRLGIEESGPTT